MGKVLRIPYFSRFLKRLRFPHLLLLVAGLLLVDILVPDPIPFLDELVLAGLTVLLSSWRRPPEEPPQREVKNVTPGRRS